MSNLKHYKPITPSLRHVVLVNKTNLWKGKPYKPLTSGLTKTGGRNNLGRTTSFHRGGGNKRKYRLIDFKRNNPNFAKGLVKRLEYDPNRSAFIALLEHNNKSLNKIQYSYIIAPQDISVGDILHSSVTKKSSADIKPGNTLMLKDIPLGTLIYNIETKPGAGASVARSAGVFAQLIKKDSQKASLRLPSGKTITVLLSCAATIGTVSNENNKNISLGKAGRSRWLGRRPVVRGVAMNPVDHPHGGGEGKTSGGRSSVTPWGIPTKGKKTRNKNKK